MKKNVPSLLWAGLALAFVELLLTWSRGHALFLSGRELLEYSLSALAGISACVLLFGGLLQLAASSRHAGLVSCALAAALSGWTAQLLTEGRRVRDLPLRPVAVLITALLAGATVFYVLRVLRGKLGTRAPQLALPAFACALLCLVADALLLPRGYPAFHVALLVLALLLASAAGLLWPTSLKTERVQRAVLGASLLLLLAAPGLLFHLAAQPNTSYAVAEKAPFTAKLMKPFTVRQAPIGSSETEREPEVSVGSGISLRERDILLITVDALRADTLRALGGHGLTPQIDRLAEQGMVFRRAYTPAPHTSYALASLLTAKFIKPVVELASAPQDHPTLPDLLKRYGYRTAAFYPPAIFFVDGARFQALQGRGFGFEYRKEMYASADARVEQLRAYLDGSEPGHPLFVWTHLFEPHEPYEPPAAYRKDETARGRYEGEVAYADAAIGKLVSLFRSKKPEGVVIITADHGEEFGDHGGSFHGSTLYDEQVRIPLVWFAPGTVAKGQSDAPVELVDVGSTLLGAMGIPRDPRMRGDVLGSVLAGGAAAAPRFAFASVEERHMVCDGRYKAVCSAAEQHCQLFDLLVDPGERHNLATEQAERLHALRSALFSFLGSIAKREALGVDKGVGFPEPLVRARLFAPGAGPDVIPLLADPRATVRVASARILGELGLVAAIPSLVKLLDDPSESARDEAAVALLSLGDARARERVATLLKRPEGGDDGLSLRRRAALALATVQAPEAAAVLGELALDEAAQEADRLRAVQALGKLGQPQAIPALAQALSSVRLREPAARALGELGGKEAADALFQQLSNERYPPARASEVSALLQLQDPRVHAQLARFLGMETSVPGGVRLLLGTGALQVPSARGASLLAPSTRRGSWSCGDQACTPAEGAQLVLPASARPLRVTVLVDGDERAVLQLGDARHLMTGGEQQLSFVRPAGGALSLPVRVEGRAALLAWVAYPELPEIPPPAPEPWDGGAPEDGASP